jgi:magnesium transporter
VIRCLYRNKQHPLPAPLEPEQIASALQDAGGLLWVDLASEAPQDCETLLLDTFGFHPLAVEDALHESHVPKVDDWGRYLYLVLHAVRFDQASDPAVDVLELDVFVGPNYVVTHHEKPIPAVERVWASCQRDERHLQKGPSYLLYHLCDELVADYMPAVEEVDDAIERMEDRVFEEPSPRLLEQMFALKRAVVLLRRMIMPQREVINKLGRGDYSVIDAEQRVFFRDVYDILLRLHDITESMRDLLAGVVDTYLSVINNRMNEVMKTLTVITTLFMPLSFLVGFFGMNFFQPVARLDAWTDNPAFVLTMVVMVLTPLTMYLWMRKRAWM